MVGFPESEYGKRIRYYSKTRKCWKRNIVLSPLIATLTHGLAWLEIGSLSIVHIIRKYLMLVKFVSSWMKNLKHVWKDCAIKMVTQRGLSVSSASFRRHARIPLIIKTLQRILVSIETKLSLSPLIHQLSDTRLHHCLTVSRCIYFILYPTKYF